MWAVSLQNIPAIRLLSERGASMSVTNHKGQSPLHVACLTGSVDVVRELVDLNADLDARDSEMTTPLIYACRRGDVAIARTLLTAGCDSMRKDARGMTALMHSACQGDDRIAREILNFDPEVLNEQDRSGWTALHWACAVSSTECTSLLLSFRRIRVFVCSKIDETPLHLAVRRGSVQIATLLLSFGPPACALSLLLKPLLDGSTALDIAAKYPECERVLLEMREKLSAGLPGPDERGKAEVAQHSSSEDVDGSGSGQDAPRASVADASGGASSALEMKEKRRLYMRNRRESEKSTVKTFEARVVELEKENEVLARQITMLRQEAAVLRTMMHRQSQA
eukprot:m.105831 g.105831  ORF g.105831 m.105831 type:complete len:338 (-) comp8929_c0_seq1:156-1169(-)